ncbi:hypothetical protein AVEN_275348-1 [Araneus ventricosus]|uniref:Uncharacterized protein n=1 Tax=Araneus ventricosus TaxID=182803 RepID=A0A4Y2FEZ7_ARAVE|nr:hypothetical protein AVEN_275348-1 [Araneus ventricosus]
MEMWNGWNRFAFWAHVLMELQKQIAHQPGFSSESRACSGIARRQCGSWLAGIHSAVAESTNLLHHTAWIRGDFATIVTRIRATHSAAHTVPRIRSLPPPALTLPVPHSFTPPAMPTQDPDPHSLGFQHRADSQPSSMTHTRKDQ